MTVDVDNLEKLRAATMINPRDWFELSGVERHDREISYRHALRDAAPALFAAYRKLDRLEKSLGLLTEGGLIFRDTST